MTLFVAKEPSLENYWRAIILFGKNSASYKFALAQSLYELAPRQNELLQLEQLALPFSRHLCAHLQKSPKQGTSKSSKFLDACARFNRGEIAQEQLIQQTVQRGFEDVLDAFHSVNGEEVAHRFFIDERKVNGGIRLTDHLFRLTESAQYGNFVYETEARWRLVEEAWRLGVSKNLISLSYDDVSGQLLLQESERRVDITSCRDSLNGYQKGRCFYCYDDISVEPGHETLCEVDHFLPWSSRSEVENVNGIWNLVLACKTCNREKSARVPDLTLLERLHCRNEYFIESHLPLRETLILQTGTTETIRKACLQAQYDRSRNLVLHVWRPEARGIPTF